MKTFAINEKYEFNIKDSLYFNSKNDTRTLSYIQPSSWGKIIEDYSYTVITHWKSSSTVVIEVPEINTGDSISYIIRERNNFSAGHFIRKSLKGYSFFILDDEEILDIEIPSSLDLEIISETRRAYINFQNMLKMADRNGN